MPVAGLTVSPQLDMRPDNIGNAKYPDIAILDALTSGSFFDIYGVIRPKARDCCSERDHPSYAVAGGCSRSSIRE